MKKKLFAVAVCAAVLWAMPVHAGFEWRGPLAAPASVAGPVDQPTASGDVDMQTPVIRWDADKNAAAMPTASVPAVETVPVTPAAAATPAVAEVIEQAAVTEAPVTDAGAVVQGFARDIPLTLALMQIVPKEHSFSFGTGVSPQTAVSWDGGRGWRHVLDAMLKPVGLGFREQGRMVIIGYVPMNDPSAANAPVVPEMQSQQTTTPAAPEVPVAAPAPSVRAQHIPETMVAPTTQTTPKDNPQMAPVDIRRVRASQLLEKPVADAEGRMAGKPVSAVEIKNVAVPRDHRAQAAPVTTPAAPAASPAQGPSLVITQNARWSAKAGDSLRQTLRAWSEKEKVDMLWSIDYDYLLPVDVKREGDYADAVSYLLDLFARVRPQPYGQLHHGQGQPKTLIVRSYDLAP